MIVAKGHHWTFPRVPVPGNKLVHGHWKVKHGERKMWGRQVLAIPPGPWRDNHVIPEGWEKLCRVRLTITMYRWNRQDPGNRETSVKPLVDALVGRGWLVDDSDKWLDLVVPPEIIDRKRQRTEVTWEAIGEP